MLTLKEYRQAEVNPQMSFFSTYKPDEILNELAAYFKNENLTFTISEKTWKVTYDAKRGGDESNDLAEVAKIQVKFLRVPDTEKLCVSFNRVGGSSMLFYDQVKKLKQSLLPCNNATNE